MDIIDIPRQQILYLHFNISPVKMPVALTKEASIAAKNLDALPPLKINVCSETQLLHIHSEGVHTAFTGCVEFLNQNKDIEVLVNNEGIGDIMHSHTYGPYFFWRGKKYKGI